MIRIRHTAPDTGARSTGWLFTGQRATTPCAAEPDAMFPGGLAHEIEYAKSFCQRCPAITRCLEWALDNGEDDGVWGGLSAAERRTLLRHRVARPIRVDDYTSTPRQMHAARTLEEAWGEFTEIDGEHVLWTGPMVVHQPGGNITPNQLAFRLDRDRWPDGSVKRTCGVDRCVKPTHLRDYAERRAVRAAS